MRVRSCPCCVVLSRGSADLWCRAPALQPLAKFLEPPCQAACKPNSPQPRACMLFTNHFRIYCPSRPAVLCFVTSGDSDDKAAWDSGEVGLGHMCGTALFSLLLNVGERSQG